MPEQDIRIEVRQSAREAALRTEFAQLVRECPIPEAERLRNLGLFLKRQDLSRILFMNDLYKQIINVHGIIVEFGVRWGQNLALFSSLRGIYEPFNYNRRIVGFDTFEGFPSVHEKDGRAEVASVGAYSTTRGYHAYLEQILNYHEQESPIAHIRKYELVQGDASVKIGEYLKENPETIIALAYFDLDLYEPTKKCLQAIQGHLTRGSVVGFDELNTHTFPGETLALKETLGIAATRICRSPWSANASYLVME